MIDIALMVGKSFLFLNVWMGIVALMSWVERRGAALMQDRPGPNRVGPFGLFQPIADGIKFLMKNDPIPAHVNKVLYALAPFLSLIPAALTIAAIPIADHIVIFDRKVFLQIADIDVGLLFVLAIGSLGIYGILFGGWASNNKFSLFGAMRASSQIISYEIPLGLGAVGAVMYYGTFNLREMVIAQDGVFWGFLPNWGVFAQPLGAFVFFIASFAETNRMPFDLPESEAELVAGFHTEYGSMKFATYMMSEYMSLTTMSSMMTVLFFGGWHLPFVTDAKILELVGSQNILALIQVATFFVKVGMFLLFYVWVRWTVPRFRFDQLMNMAWKNLIPLGIVNIIASAILMYVKGVL